MARPPLILLALPLALALGAGGGYVAKTKLAASAADPKAAHDAAPAKKAKPDKHGEKTAAPVYMKFGRQFVTPLSATRNSLMILDIQIELAPAAGDAAYGLEPRLRDAFLQVLLDAASREVLAGVIEDPVLLEDLRAALLERAKAEIGPDALSVLILDIAVQHR